MMKLTIAALLYFLFLLPGCGGEGSSPPGALAPTFYVDAAGGADSNSGTTPLAPWQTLARVSAAAFEPGSMVYLKRGSIWYEQLTIPSSGITIDAYGTGPLPEVNGSASVSAWTVEGGGLYSSSTITLGSGEALGNLSENGTMMRFVAWNSDAATTLSGAAVGSFSYDQGLSKLYMKPSSPPGGNTYRASIKTFGITAEGKSDITIRNVEITRFSLHGIHLKDCIRCSIRDSVISSGGGALIAPGIYAGNGIEFGNSSADVRADSVTVSEIFDSGITPQTYANGQALSAIQIRDSQIASCGFAGIEVSVLSNGGTTGSAISDVLISGVTISGSGGGWSGRRYGTEGHGIRIQADSGAGAMTGIRIERTAVRGAQGDGIKIGGEIGEVTLHRMDIAYNAVGINLSEPSAASIALFLTSSLVHHNASWGVLYNAPAAAGFALQQNTFVDNGGINLGILGWSGSATVRNNLYYGSAAMTHLYSAVTLTAATIDYNCYNEFVSNTFGYGANAYSTVAALRSATGFEVNGTGGDVGLANPANGDFSLLNTSVCTTLGTAAVGVVDDYSGYTFADPPSGGAYQYR